MEFQLSVSTAESSPERQVAVTVALICWLLSVYRRETCVCAIVQCGNSAAGGADRLQLPLIGEVKGDLTLDEHCDAWQASLQRTIEAGPVPLTDLQAALEAAEYQQANLLQQIHLCWNDAVREPDGFDGPACPARGGYPLQIHVAARGGEQYIRVCYDRTVIARELVEGVFEKYQLLRHDYARHRSRRLRDIELLSATDRRLLGQWNATAKAYDLSLPYHTFIQHWAKATPDRVALQLGDSELTYLELDQYANILARMLSARGIGPGDRVALYLARSLEMVIGIIAINKIGASFVPVDPQSPSVRIQHILEDSGMRVLLVSRRSGAKLQTLLNERLVAAADLLFVDDVYVSTIQPLIDDILVDDCSAVAYLIYTSGSTGTPKGVQVTHRALINHNLGCREIYGLTQFDTVLQLASIGFDHSLEEMLPTLISGACLVLYPDNKGVSIEQLNRVLQVHQVTVFMPTTALWKLWAAHSLQQGRFELPELRVCAIGGERCPKELLIAWLRLCGEQIELQAGYGVTEAAITSTMWRPSVAALEADPMSEVPIGKPIGNTRLYVVDQQLRRVPVGAEGELCIAGEGVAVGYWNRPAETTKRFLTEPEGSEPGAMYRTGDIVRFTADGNLVYLTREDNQVKVNGYRVELTELEVAISTIPGVQECVVVANERAGGQKHLCAFLRTDEATRITKADLHGKLPAYAIPQQLIHLRQFPLNSSAKIDRQQLARQAAALLTEQTAAQHVPSTHAHGNLSRTHARDLIASTWRQTLGVAEIQTDEDFFRIGGSSLLAVLMIEKLNSTLPQRIDLSAFLGNPTIEGTVDALLGKSVGAGPLPANFHESPQTCGDATTTV